MRQRHTGNSRQLSCRRDAPTANCHQPHRSSKARPTNSPCGDGKALEGKPLSYFISPSFRACFAHKNKFKYGSSRELQSFHRLSQSGRRQSHMHSLNTLIGREPFPRVRVSKMNSARQLRLATSAFWVLTMGWTWAFFRHVHLKLRQLQNWRTQRRSPHEIPRCAGPRSCGNIAVKTPSQRSAVLNSPSACPRR